MSYRANREKTPTKMIQSVDRYRADSTVYCLLSAVATSVSTIYIFFNYSYL